MPELTTSEEPTTRRASEADTREAARRKTLRGMNSPKNTTSGFRTPPQTLHRGTTKRDTSPTSASPSGASAGESSSNHGFSRRIRSATASRAKTCPQARQTTLCIVPCSGTTLRLPAAACSPSTFCVAMPETMPRPPHAASMRCAAFGRAAPNLRQPRWLPAQYRCRAASDERNCAIVIGCRTGEPSPR